jgi:predicted nucleic acid-binding protein
MTIAELHIGVLAASHPDVRAARLRTLAEVERTFEPLPVDPNVARRFAEIVVDAKRGGRRVGVIDALIAATGAAHDLPIFTQDADFEGLAGVQVVRV